jgi:putative transposase
MILTLRFRLKDRHAAELNRQARAVNFVWNYCNETQQKAAKYGRRWLTANELGRLTAGSSTELGLLADTIEKVAQQYVRSRRQHKRAWLRFRGRKSLGWVPFKDDAVRFDGAAFRFRGVRYVPMHTRELPADARILCGSFSQDARGRWYINCPLEFANDSYAPAKPGAVGIDLGLKDLATLSTGERIEAPQHYRRLEAKLGKAQRATKRRLAKAIAAKVANARKDHLHKASARIALAHNLIVVGNVSSEQLARTSMAKSVLDAGWSTFRNQLSYKAIRHGGRLIEADERLTTQVCSACGSLPDGRPRGIADLGIREWTCGDCGAVHDRDVNAALNILRVGLHTLAEGARANAGAVNVRPARQEAK